MDDDIASVLEIDTRLSCSCSLPTGNPSTHYYYYCYYTRYSSIVSARTIANGQIDLKTPEPLYGFVQIFKHSSISVSLCVYRIVVYMYCSFLAAVGGCQSKKTLERTALRRQNVKLYLALVVVVDPGSTTEYRVGAEESTEVKECRCL